MIEVAKANVDHLSLRRKQRRAIPMSDAIAAGTAPDFPFIILLTNFRSSLPLRVARTLANHAKPQSRQERGREGYERE